MSRFTFLLLLILVGSATNAQLPETDWQPEADVAEASVEDGQLLLEENTWEHLGRIRWQQSNRQERLRLPGMTEAILLAIEAHEQLYGPLLDFEEFQQIADLPLELLRSWKPYIGMELSFKLRFTPEKSGQHQLLIRNRRILEAQQGYDPLRAAEGRSHYPGSPWHQLIRYRYDGHPLQLGLVLERDPGELPWHFSLALSGKGPGKSRWILGDMRYGAGYGLTINTGFYAGKSSDPLLAVPVSSGLRPAASAAEWQRFRGVGLQLALSHKLEYTVMLSFARQHGTVSTDVEKAGAGEINNLYVSGLFRTQTEREKWRQVGEFTAAQSLQWQYKNWLTGWSSVFHRWSAPFVVGQRPDQLHQFSGQQQWLNSVWWRYNWRNLQTYGEWAIDAQADQALIMGCLWPMHKNFGLQGSIRQYAARYQALYAQSLSARGQVQGESGILAGFWWEPARKWRLQALVDYYRWPWLRYQIDRPSGGYDRQFLLFYQQRKQAQWSLRLRSFTGERNRSEAGPLVDAHQRWQLRLLYRFQPHPLCEVVFGYQQSSQSSPEAAWGYGFWQSIRFQSENKKLSLAAQMILFDTDNFDNRLYIAERDLRYASSMPVLSGEGQRWVVLAQYKLGKSWDVGLRFARLRYFDREEVGSGLELIRGPQRSELKMQLGIRF